MVENQATSENMSLFPMRGGNPKDQERHRREVKTRMEKPKIQQIDLQNQKLGHEFLCLVVLTSPLFFSFPLLFLPLFWFCIFFLYFHFLVFFFYWGFFLKFLYYSVMFCFFSIFGFYIFCDMLQNSYQTNEK